MTNDLNELSKHFGEPQAKLTEKEYLITKFYSICASRELEELPVSIIEDAIIFYEEKLEEYFEQVPLLIAKWPLALRAKNDVSAYRIMIKSFYTQKNLLSLKLKETVEKNDENSFRSKVE